MNPNIQIIPNFIIMNPNIQIIPNFIIINHPNIQDIIH